MELLEVFDSNGNRIGKFLERGNKEGLAEGEHFAVAIIFLENSKGEFLMQKTPERKGGKYSSTGGHIDKGETPLVAIKREVLEEIGLDISNEPIEDIGFFMEKGPIRFLFYLKKDIDVNTLHLQESEVASVRYMTVAEIKELIEREEITKSHGIGFEKVLAYLNTK